MHRERQFLLFTTVLTWRSAAPREHIVSEQGGSTVTFDVTVVTDVGSPFQLMVTGGSGSATEGSDYVAVNETLSFGGAVNQTEQFQVTILDDSEFELDEYVSFNYATDIQEAVIGIPDVGVTFESEETTGLGFSNGTIIAGGSGIDDVLTVSPSGSDIVADLNGVMLSVPSSEVTGVGLDDDTINGHDGHDMILGNEGVDRLFGNDGADVMIGGVGTDSMVGADGEDLMISGSTTLPLADLEIARDEWKAIDRTPVERRQNLIDGTGTARATTVRFSCSALVRTKMCSTTTKQTPSAETKVRTGSSRISHKTMWIPTCFSFESQWRQSRFSRSAASLRNSSSIRSCRSGSAIFTSARRSRYPTA